MSSGRVRSAHPASDFGSLGLDPRSPVILLLTARGGVIAMDFPHLNRRPEQGRQVLGGKHLPLRAIQQNPTVLQEDHPVDLREDLFHPVGHQDNGLALSLIHISEPTRRTPISYAVFCLKK